jgi:hypothetical protein
MVNNNNTTDENEAKLIDLLMGETFTLKHFTEHLDVSNLT